ncbi:hypothetical protein PHMEG_0007902 [Phytophthora megakarya]|uniref:Uncharacterized protein n=1 Tax=Phytophthora megakarya TaxID=4795 RepID=A0A225WMF8_9STRA|nr:hypothetical protein PHMEG_0007902 [Phytophthora megakarya]
MGESIAATLGLPLLWAAMEPLENYDYALLPNILQQRILHLFANVVESPGLNPVVREGFFVTGDGLQLNLVILEGEVIRREFAALHAQIAAVSLHTTDEVQQLRRAIQREMQKLQAICRRVAMQPAVRRVAPAHVPAVDNLPGSRRVLVARPKGEHTIGELACDLVEFLSEFPPITTRYKDFTAVERGANKFAYSSRKVFWDVVSILVRSGFTIYGRQLPVSNILVALRADRKRGGHLGLRV